MDLWSWICDLPDSEDWSTTTDSSAELTFLLASSKPSPLNKTDTNLKSIQFHARRKLNSYSELLEITFSVSFEEKTLWVSDTCPVHSEQPFLPLVLQILEETMSRSPTAHDSLTCPLSQHKKLKPDPVVWVLESHSPESFSSFFNVIFLTRLFWLCACDAPSEVGSLYFHSILAPNLEAFSCNHAPVLRAFFVSAGIDAELSIMRTFGYMLTKWLILREVGVGLQLVTPANNLGFSYALETHGLWVLKGYAPVSAMTRTLSKRVKTGYPVLEAKESVLKYALAHQQLEAVIQLDYSVEFKENFIMVSARVDNIRINVAKLGFTRNEEEIMNERHFPSRVRVWVGPEVGSSYVTSLSLGRSTEHGEKEVETEKTMKGSFGKTKVPRVKAMTRTTTRTKVRSWRWDQDSEGHVVIFDTTLCDTTTGIEVATWQPSIGGGESFEKRSAGANRSFSKMGNWVLGGEGAWVKWRLKKEMEGSVMKWRIGGEVWATYLPNELNTSYYETRFVKWCDEVDLPLIPLTYTN